MKIIVSNKLMVLIVGMILPLLLSCSNLSQNEESKEIRELEIIPGESSILNLSELGESITYIQLETNEHCLIGSSYSINLFEDKVFVFDAMSSRILCFSDNGDFLFKIDRKGKGPGEYVHLSDFVIDKNNELILIYDRMQMVVFEFNLSGEFIKSNKVGVQLAELGVIDSESYYFYNYDGPDPSFVLQQIRKSDGHKVSEQIIQNKNTDFLRHSSFNQDNAALTLCYAFNDTIYNIGTNGEVKPFFVVNFPKKNDLLNKLSKIPYGDREGHSQVLKNGDWAQIGYHRTSSDYLYFYYLNRSNLHQVLFSFQTGKHLHFDKINNDLDGMPLSWRPVFLTEKSIIFKVEPLSIIEELDKSENLKIRATLADLKPIVEDANPLIAIIQIESW